MPYVVGIVLSLGVALFARSAGFDRDRAFYPTVLIVIASYYVLFAAMSDSIRTVLLESVPMTAFVIAAVVGFKSSAWIVVAGLAGHGVFDALHGHVLQNSGVPVWWPAFCLAYDLGAAGSLAWLINRQPQGDTPMIMKTIFALCGVLAVSVLMTAQDKAARVIDLGHVIQTTDPSWDGAPAFQRSVVATIEKDGYAGGKITIEEHFSTHVDAPAHFAPGGWTVDRIPVDRLYRPGIRVDVSRQSLANPDYRVTAADLQAFEKSSGRIPEGVVVLIATGWDRYWPDRARYMNEKDGVKHFPGLSVEATNLLARDRRVAGIGIDTPSIDYGRSTAFEAHHVSMALNVYHIENMAHLMDLPASGFQVVVAPINIGGGSGGPARVFALLSSGITR